MAKSKKEKRAPQQIKLGLFTKLLLLALIAALGWQLYHLHGQVQIAQTQKDELTVQVQQQRQTNEKLQEDITEGGTQEQMEEIARNELGLVAPGDRVFYDVSN